MPTIKAKTANGSSAKDNFKKAFAFLNLDRKYVNKVTGKEKYRKLCGIPLHDEGEQAKLIELLNECSDEQEMKDVVCHLIQQGRISFVISEDSESEEDDWEAA